MAKHPKWQVAIGSTHQKLIDNLQAAHSKEFNKLGKQLDRVRNLRHHADYDLHKEFTYQDAKKAISQSQKILEEISALDQAGK